MKKIVVFCDGTWNQPDAGEQGVSTATNVVKLAEALAPADQAGTEQRIYYDTGVGTSGSRLRRLYEGATGSGISRNIQQAYRFISEVYEPGDNGAGDQLYLFGFSRGAFTVRSLAGLIRNCGVLRRESLDKIAEAYALYKSKAETSKPRAREAVLFRRTNAVEDVTPVSFIGVWDTVGSLGNPLLLNGILSRRNSFHDTDLSSTVGAAYQALAVDEKRQHFKPTYWHQPQVVENQVLEQVWLAGCHSNVGGGYPRTGLSDFALGWMRDRAVEHGLSFRDVALAADATEAVWESRKGFYSWIKAFHRPVGAPSEKGATNEVVHASVLEKYQADASYRPPKLVEYLAVR